MIMKVFSYMEKGKGKDASEDTILVGNMLLKEGFYFFEQAFSCVAVADGVGGNAGGRDASEFVASMFKENCEDDLISAARKINEELISYAREVRQKENMATTFSGIFFCNSLPYKVLHVGNTRVAAIQGVYLKQLTTDHTTVEWLRSRGMYEEADRAPGNEITACFGSGNTARLHQLTVIDIDRDFFGYFLTSDGIHDYLETEDLEDFVDAGDFSEDAFAALAQKAAENGSTDDKSMVLICMKG
jgi:protein phosphatase